MAHDQEVMSSNSGTVYWMNVSDDVSYYIKENLKIKEAKYGTPKKNIVIKLNPSIGNNHIKLWNSFWKKLTLPVFNFKHLGYQIGTHSMQIEE